MDLLKILEKSATPISDEIFKKTWEFVQGDELEFPTPDYLLMSKSKFIEFLKENGNDMQGLGSTGKINYVVTFVNPIPPNLNKKINLEIVVVEDGLINDIVLVQNPRMV